MSPQDKALNILDLIIAVLIFGVGVMIGNGL